MSDQQHPQGQAPPGAEQMSPEQMEALRQMEEEMARVRVQDVLTQSVVSLINLAARRIAKDDERDLEQGKLGIDAVRALVDLLEDEPAQEVRQALSQVQMLYAQAAGGDAGEGGGTGGPGGAGDPEAQAAPDDADRTQAPGRADPAGGPGGDPAGGPRKPPPGLWVPGS